MPDWLAPVLAALIAAGAVMVTNVLNTRNSRDQRREERKERAADREHELAKWRAEREAGRRQWLLDRRSEAYTNFWEWAYRAPDDPKREELRTTFDDHLRAYGSAALMTAYLAWLKADTAWIGPTDEDPTWLEVVKCMRADLGSD